MATSKPRIRRISDEPAWVLHGYDWSESSLILDVFTRHQGRVVLAAKGAKRPHSQLRPVLLPLQPITLSYTGESEVKNLRSADWQGGDLMPEGDALIAGLYLNELLMRLLPREDPHEALFDGYSQTVRTLTQSSDLPVSVVLRGFELMLLRAMGHLPELDRYTLTQQALEGPAVLTVESGLLSAPQQDKALPAQAWLLLHQALQREAPWSAVLAALATWDAAWRSALQHQLRQVLHYHCGVQQLHTRQLMIDLQTL